MHLGIRPVKVILQSFYLLSKLFRALLAKTKYDIVHIQGHLPMFFLFIPFLKIKKKRIYWTLHDVELMPSYGGIKGRIEVIYIKISTQPILLKKYAHVIIVHGLFLQVNSKPKESTKIRYTLFLTLTIGIYWIILVICIMRINTTLLQN